MADVAVEMFAERILKAEGAGFLQRGKEINREETCEQWALSM